MWWHTVTHGIGRSESRCALIKGVGSDVMSTSVYTDLSPFNFIRKYFLQICLYLNARRLSERMAIKAHNASWDFHMVIIKIQVISIVMLSHWLCSFQRLENDTNLPNVADYATQHQTLEQCFSTFVRPRPGKFFFHKTRARSQQIYS